MSVQKTIGFLGSGSMSEAIIRGLLRNKFVPPTSIFASDPNGNRVQQLRDTGINMVRENRLVVKNCDYVIICVKPYLVQPVLKQLCEDSIDMNKIFISVAAGLKLSTLSSFLPLNTKVIRVMPNTPSAVGEAVSAYDYNQFVTSEEADFCHQIFASVGLALHTPEKNLDAISGLSGCGPAYAFMFLEALADAGVRNGIPRAIARQLAAQTLLGAAKMALAFPNTHVADLRNSVESPGGATIAATNALEMNNFRGSIIQAVNAATLRCQEMSRAPKNDHQ